MTTSAELDAKVEELERQLEEARKAAEAQRRQERSAIVAQLNELIAKHGIAPTELTFARSGKVSKASASKASKGTPGKPKYRHPDTDATWTGHGKPPGWIPADKEARKQYLIEQ
ncbi:MULTISPECIES: H-NS histone family protein [Burkholderia cepacia complex]|uniref:H-NS histone family protein n=1 Tax=Burkholderia cepacia complex TaxID=87882 RepID=UPI0009B51B5E|nr:MULTISPECIES: H-NS histone family protein [Burkholderia cepacia complex]MDN8036988.1 H-NS histone family protein [Burkholderia vietnamiensis]